MFKTELDKSVCETTVSALTLPVQGTLGMKNDRVIKQLLEMLDLDSSEYVRLMVGTNKFSCYFTFYTRTVIYQCVES